MSHVKIKVPSVGESITEVTIGTWAKKNGDYVNQDDIIVTIESDKASLDLQAEKAGILSIIANEGDTVKIGAEIGSIAEGAAPAVSTKVSPTPSQSALPSSSATTTKSSEPGGHPSPAAAKILAEKGVSPSAVSGSGPGGRITKDDAQKASAPSARPAPELKSVSDTPALKLIFGSRDASRTRMSPLRKTIARRLVEVKNVTAMLTTFNEVDMSEVMDLRKKYGEKFLETYGVKLGMMSFFTMAVCHSARLFPQVNSSIDGDDVVTPNYVDVGIAVSAPKGLVVPILKNAESMNLGQIELAIAELAKKARDNKLKLEEMQGGTFTITNGGVFGSLMSTPIINAPQSAILGMHNIVERPVARNGQVVIRPMMYIALSYDHRIIDGRESVGFLKTIKECIEEPGRLLMGF